MKTLEPMEQKILKRPILAFLLALTGVVFFSSKSVFVKMAYTYDVDAISLVTLRLLFSLPVYVVVLLVSFRGKSVRKFRIIDYLKIVSLGILGYYLASILDFVGLNYVSASLERLILFVYPTMVLIISSIFNRSKPTFEQKLAVIITYFGVVLAFYRNTYISGNSLWIGVVFIFASALSYSFYLVGTGSLISVFGTALFTSMVMIVSTIAASTHYLMVQGAEIFSLPRQVYFIAMLMALISTVIPSFLLSEAIRQWGPSNVAIVGSFGPISTIILAGIVLGEKITVFQMLGTIIVISGVLLLANNKKEKIQPKVQTVKKNI